MTEKGFIGQKGLNRKLRKMGPKITEVMKPVMKNLAQEGAVEMQSIILNEAFKEGDLARAVHYQLDSRGVSFKLGFWEKGNKKRWKSAGWRAHFVNFGTHKIERVDFVSRTFNLLRRNAAKDIDKAVDKGLKEVARGN